MKTKAINLVSDDEDTDGTEICPNDADTKRLKDTSKNPSKSSGNC